MTREEIVAKYREEKDRLQKVEKALEIQKGKVGSLARQLFTEHGKGPHDLGDGRVGGYIVACRGSGEDATYFLTPAVKTKAGKETATAPS